MNQTVILTQFILCYCYDYIIASFKIQCVTIAISQLLLIADVSVQTVPSLWWHWKVEMPCLFSLRLKHLDVMPWVWKSP